ncbi:MAG: SUMF1/EgtB/PvdO family nonheme iron enzyme [Anaerolineales bacterium]
MKRLSIILLVASFSLASCAPAAIPTEPVTPPRIREKDGMMMIFVPAGPFTMGITAEQALADCQKFPKDCYQNSFNNEQPPHRVNLDGYWIDSTEVTNSMYARCVRAGACQPPFDNSSSTRTSYYGNSRYSDYPVVYVDWAKARDYCRWAGASLPTEAEWEKAERGTDGRTYPWGNSPPTCQLLNFQPVSGSCVGDTSAVGSYPSGASPYGVLDMVGNVWEWLADWYSETYYASSPSNNPTGPTSGMYHVLRGGSWAGGEGLVRASNRDWENPMLSANFIGFRCSRGLNNSTASFFP